jgi:hypothetical protein
MRIIGVNYGKDVPDKGKSTHRGSGKAKENTPEPDDATPKDVPDKGGDE